VWTCLAQWSGLHRRQGRRWRQRRHPRAMGVADDGIHRRCQWPTTDEWVAPGAIQERGWGRRNRIGCGILGEWRQTCERRANPRKSDPRQRRKKKTDEVLALLSFFLGVKINQICSIGIHIFIFVLYFSCRDQSIFN
jgi:hypothetical protein